MTYRPQMIAALAFLTICTIPVRADVVLFNNGAANGGTNNGSLLDCADCRSAAGVEVYDNFQVTGTGWDVTGLAGNYLTFSTSPLPTTAYWEIRQGITQGNGGTLIASGTTAVAASQIATPPAFTGDFAYNIGVTIPTLNLGAGTYWMTLAPNSPANETFLIGTDGTGGVDSLIDGTSFVNGTSFVWQNVGSYLQPFTHSSSYDFSYSITGTPLDAVPEPNSLLLLAILLPIGVAVRTRSRNCRL